MKAAEFKDWIKSIERMSRSQRDKLGERLEGKAGTDAIMELIEQGQSNERICLYCQRTKLYRWGKASELQRYRCRHCNRMFNALTGTTLARLRHKDKWFDYEQAMVQTSFTGSRTQTRRQSCQARRIKRTDSCDSNT